MNTRKTPASKTSSTSSKKEAQPKPHPQRAAEAMAKAPAPTSAQAPAPAHSSLPPAAPPPADQTGELVRRHEVKALCVVALPPETTAELGPAATQALIEQLDAHVVIGVVQAKDHVFNLVMSGIVWMDGEGLAPTSKSAAASAADRTA